MKKTLFALAAVGALALTACSPDDSDATPGDGKPQATDTPNVPADPNWKDPSFCQAIADSSAWNEDVISASDDLNAILEDSANWDSPEAVAALHEQGARMLENADNAADYFAAAAREADDPAAASALETMSEFYRMMFRAMGQAAVDADSVMDYAMNAWTFMDTEEMTTLTAELEAAGPIISSYIYESCGISNFGS